MHLHILDKQRLDILPLFSFTKEAGFYLAGGTALALHIGHRDSIDFDFFTEKPIDTKVLFEQCRELFAGHSIQKIQEEKNTLALLIDGAVQVSFMTYSYPLLRSSESSEYFNLASIADIGCMKLSAITSRSVLKDYVDLYFILRLVSLKELLILYRAKYSDDTVVVLKSLAYFEDIEMEPIIYKENNEVDFVVVKNFLKQQAMTIY